MEANSTPLNFSAWLGCGVWEELCVSQQYKLYLHCKKHKVWGEIVEIRKEMLAKVGMLWSLAWDWTSLIGKIWEVCGEALPQEHTCKGVSVSGGCFQAVFLAQMWVWRKIILSYPHLLCLGACCGVTWMRCWVPKPVAALLQCGHLVMRGLEAALKDPWNTGGVGMESTALTGLNPCSLGAALLIYGDLWHLLASCCPI